MGVANYVATLKLTPITDGNRSFAEWSAEFDCDEGRERELTQLIGDGVFQGGLQRVEDALSVERCGGLLLTAREPAGRARPAVTFICGPK